MAHLKQYMILLAAVLSLIGLSAPASAQVSELMHFETVEHIDNSGAHQAPDGPLLDESGGKILTNAYATLIQAPDVNLIRVHFSQFELGRHSEIRLTSLKDGHVQRFTHESLAEWNGWSAIFNGDAVLVQLLVAPGDIASFSILELAINDPPRPGDEGLALSLCGDDNRVSSSDSRVGRLSGPNCGDGGNCGGCTAWLTSIGSAITAGHCGNGQGGLIEFNVPMSASDGTPNAAPPEDQYPVGTTWYAFQNGGDGFDWAIMNVGANANTGLRAHWVQGYFHLSPALPSDGATLRITGFGVDNTPTGSNPFNCCAWDNDGNCTHPGCNSTSLTRQTSTGPKTDHDSNRLFYQVDTEPANSGSPVIRSSNSFAIGVHTHGGCVEQQFGENKGTRLTQSVLSAWLVNFLNDNYGPSVFVDWANVSTFEAGLPLFPARTVPAGAVIAPTGGTVAIAGGSYPASAGNTGTISNAVTLRAVSGVVTIGQ